MTQGEDMLNEKFTLEHWSNPVNQTWKVSMNNKVTEICCHLLSKSVHLLAYPA